MANRGMWKFLASKGAAWGEAIVFTSVGGLAAYLKPQIGVPILVIFLICGLYLIWRAYRQQPQVAEGIKSSEDVTFSRKQQAQNLHLRIIRKEPKLWKAIAQVPKGERPPKNEGVKKILNQISLIINSQENSELGDPKLDEQFALLVEAYNWFVLAGISPSGELLIALNKIHSNIRDYINNELKE